VFDRSGALILDYKRDLFDSRAILGCYAVSTVGTSSVLLSIYPGYELVEVDVVRKTQRVWETPAALHGAAAISARSSRLLP
jgi:hypothetical protein